MINNQIAQFPIVYANSMGLGKIAIGWGAHSTVGNECKAADIKKALIVTTGLKGTGIIDEIKSVLHYHGVSTELYNNVTSNPKDHEVMECYEVFKDSQCDGMVSVGGGSSHDCAKAARIVAANDGLPISHFKMTIDPPWMLEMHKYKPVKIPQISVNTTAGTGAESSGGAAITHTDIKAKRLAVIPGAAPHIALNDPLLARIQPQNIAAQTGWDAFCHAFELYVSSIQSHFSLALAYRTIKLVAENLREFAYNRMNHTACENIVWAASMSGALGLSCGGGMGIVHGLGHGLSVLRGVHHGLASAVVTVPGERYNQGVCPDKFAQMAEAMGVDTRGMSKMEASDKWFEEVERLLADLHIQTGNLKKQFGLTKEDCPHIVKVQHSIDVTRQGNPRDYNYDECLELLEGLL
jgi:alcohol dehydrogenase class IV